MKKLLSFAVALFSVLAVSAAEEEIWDLKDLMETVPKTYPAPEFESKDHPDVKAFFYDGEFYRGNPTKVFAYYGKPSGVSGKLPAIILVHGGGGSAFRFWVEKWIKRGYAVLAMDLAGGTPENFGDEDGAKVSQPHDNGGPGMTRIFVEASLPPEEQWPYHAVAAIIRANTLLRSFPEIDANRIGITGISWGAVASEIALGLDHRFRFAAIIYGNGFLGESSSWKTLEFDRMPPEKAERWLKLWDPSNYLAKSNLPILFCNGARDRHFRPDSWIKTAKLVKPENRYLSLRPGMGHSHKSGDPIEVAAFADMMVKGGSKLPVVKGETGGKVSYSSSIPVKQVFFCHTSDTGEWPNRVWKMDKVKGFTQTSAQAAIPAGTTAYFFVVMDSQNRMMSSETKFPDK